jgi:hypothetical protein
MNSTTPADHMSTCGAGARGVGMRGAGACKEETGMKL